MTKTEMTKVKARIRGTYSSHKADEIADMLKKDGFENMSAKNVRAIAYKMGLRKYRRRTEARRARLNSAPARDVAMQVEANRHALIAEVIVSNLTKPTKLKLIGSYL